MSYVSEFAGIDRDFGASLRELRETRGLSQAWLAVKAGLDPSTVWLIEHGRTRPHRVTVAALMRVLRTRRRAQA